MGCIVDYIKYIQHHTAGTCKLFMVMHALITSRLKYCNELYMGMPLNTQNVSTRLLSLVGYWDCITLVLRDLPWLPLCFQGELKVLIPYMGWCQSI